MATWQNYLQPTSLDRALLDLKEHAPSARVIAGGTDLLLDLQQGRETPVETLVDISSIDELAGIYKEEDRLIIGAAATHQEIISSPEAKKHAQCLVEACSLIGGPQVRNVATLGGNVAHGLPAADGTIALLALGAQAEIAGEKGREWNELESLFAGPGETTFDRSRQILVRFRLPLRRASEGSAFARVMRPQGVAIAILNMAGWLKVGEDDRIEEARIAVGPSGPRPRRARKAEAHLIGRSLETEKLATLNKLILDEAQLRTSRHRATKAYRQHLVGVLVERTLPAAYARARGLAMEKFEEVATR